jgi:hypothetical protein
VVLDLECEVVADQEQYGAWVRTGVKDKHGTKEYFVYTCGVLDSREEGEIEKFLSNLQRVRRSMDAIGCYGSLAKETIRDQRQINEMLVPEPCDQYPMQEQSLQNNPPEDTAQALEHIITVLDMLVKLGRHGCLPHNRLSQNTIYVLDGGSIWLPPPMLPHGPRDPNKDKDKDKDIDAIASILLWMLTKPANQSKSSDEQLAILAQREPGLADTIRKFRDSSTTPPLDRLLRFRRSLQQLWKTKASHEVITPLTELRSGRHLRSCAVWALAVLASTFPVWSGDWWPPAAWRLAPEAALTGLNLIVVYPSGIVLGTTLYRLAHRLWCKKFRRKSSPWELRHKVHWPQIVLWAVIGAAYNCMLQLLVLVSLYAFSQRIDLFDQHLIPSVIRMTLLGGLAGTLAAYVKWEEN